MEEMEFEDTDDIHGYKCDIRLPRQETRIECSTVKEQATQTPEEFRPHQEAGKLDDSDTPTPVEV